tara:strand:- start:23 stop:424 length:402 start_codon:yes stop_codon:yes gene_type:complete
LLSQTIDFRLRMPEIIYSDAGNYSFQFYFQKEDYASAALLRRAVMGERREGQFIRMGGERAKRASLVTEECEAKRSDERASERAMRASNTKKLVVTSSLRSPLARAKLLYIATSTTELTFSIILAHSLHLCLL